MESYLLKNNGKTVELSPKQLDYYYASGNPIDNYLVASFSSNGYKSRNIGEGHNLLLAALGLSAGQIPVNEAGFFQIMQQNDALLRNYDTWNDYQDHTILDQISGTAETYTKALSYNQVTAIKSQYLPTNVTYVKGSSSTDLSQIKQSVMEHGAAVVGTIAPEVESCWDDDTKTIIDRGGVICGTENGHAMTIVGWDDNHSYTNPSDGSTKTGAFILQNSWGTSDYFSKNGYTLESLIEDGLIDISGYDEERLQEILQALNDMIDNWDADEIVYLGYELVGPNLSATDFLMLDDIEDNSYDSVYHVTSSFLKNQTYDSEHEDNSIIYTYSTDESEATEIIKELSIFVATPFNIEAVYDIYIDSGNGFVSLGSVTYPAYTAGAKFIKLSNPVEVSSDFRLKFSITVGGSSVSLEGVDNFFSMAALANYKTTSSPTEPSDPSNPSDPDPTDPTDPTDPDPTDPTDPSDPTDPDPTSDPDPEQTTGTGKVVWFEGNNNYLEGVDSELVLSIDYPLASFKSLLIDGVELDSANYDLESGSTIITLHGDYLNTLESGTHTLRALFTNNRTAETSFTVLRDDVEVPKTDGPSTPQTGIMTKANEGNTPATIYILPVLGIMLIIANVVISAKKSKVGFNKR